MSCGACNKPTKGKGNTDEGTSNITCSKCATTYHILCLNMSRDDHKLLRTKHSQYICPSCKLKSKNVKTDNTPVRSKQHKSDVESDGSDFMVTAQQLASLEVPAQAMQSFTKAVADLQNIFITMKNEMLDLTKSLNATTEDITMFRQELGQMKAQIKELDGYKAEVVELRAEVADLRRIIATQEQRRFLNDVEITGITEDCSENLPHLVNVISATLGVDLDPRDVDDVRRVGTRGGAGPLERPRPIVVTMSRRAPRDQLLRAARVRRGLTTENLKLPVNEEQSTSQDVEVGVSQNGDAEPKVSIDASLELNGHQPRRKILQRIETVPDIKKDTSGITTQYIATGIVNLGAFAAGACIAWSSSALPLLHPLNDSGLVPGHANLSAVDSAHPRLELTDSEASWTASLLCFGAVCGAIPTGLISQYFGRKKTLLYLALPLMVSWLLVASSPNVYGLYVGRFVGGIAVGAFSVGIPPYVEDIAEPELLPTLANFYHVQLACGVLFGYVVGMVSSISWLSFLCASIPIAFFIAFIFLPESPAYLMSQGKHQEAKAALRYFRGIDNNVDSEFKELKETFRNYAKLKVTFKDLLSTKITVKALIVSFGLMIFQQMSGIYAVLFFAQYIFNTFSISQSLPSAAIILGFCLVSSTYFSTMLLRTVRRRVLLMTSFLFMAISLGSLAIYYHLLMSKILESGTWIPLATLCLYVSVYATGVGPIPWLMLREIFAKAARRRATAITVGIHWLLAFGVTKMFQHLVKKVRPGWALWYFASICLIGLIFVYFFVPETKGRSLEEIQNEFDGIHKKRKHRHVIEVETVSET